MTSNLRIVGLTTELFHAPVTLSDEILDKLYEALSQHPRTTYQCKSRLPSGAIKFHDEPSKNVRSEVVFAPDRTFIMQMSRLMQLSEFESRVYRVGAQAMNVLGVTSFEKQTISHRSIYTPRYSQVGRTYVLDRICRQEDKLESSFKRPIKRASLHLAFSGTRDYPGEFQVIIDSQLLRPEDVTIDIRAVFAHKRIDRAALEPASRNFEYVEEHVLKRVLPYLEQFDVPRPKFEPPFKHI